MIASTFFTIISVPYDAVINAHENMLVYAIIGIIEAVFKLSIALYIATTELDKLITYGLLSAGLSIILLVIQRIYCLRKYDECKINLRKYYQRSVFKEMTSFGGWSLIFSAASMVTMQGVSIVLNSFFGVVVNAAQGIANQISGQLMVFSNTMLKALNPMIVKSEGANNRQQMLEASIVGNKLSFFLFTFFTIPAIVEMPYILNFWLKNVPEYAVVFCQLNLLRISVSQLTVTFPTSIGATGEIKEFSIVRSLLFVMILPISYLMFFFHFPPYLIYINLLVMVIILLFVHAHYMKKICGLAIETFMKQILIPCLTSVAFPTILATLTSYLLSPGFLRLSLVTVISTIFSILSIGLWGLTNKERDYFKSVILYGIEKLKLTYR